MMCTMQAQVVEKDEAALIYYTPKTVVSVDFTYTVETQERGIYAAYAEAMLGITDVIAETQTICTIKEARIGTITEADYSRPHKIVAEPGFPMLLSMNEKGLLTGYNVPPVQKTAPAKKPATTPEKRQKAVSVTTAAPFTEDVLKASTPLAQAHAVAQQIFHLRETRMYLLNGEVEHAPADGQAMQQVLDELAKQERQLTELFTGKKSLRTEHKTVRMYPETKQQILYFSRENGFTDADNVEADAVVLNATLHVQKLAASTNKKKSAALSQLMYNLPGSATLDVMIKGNIIASRTFPVAQLGVDVPLAKDLFSGKELPIIVFSEKTGNIISISK